jgi:hypothetical protein
MAKVATNSAASKTKTTRSKKAVKSASSSDEMPKNAKAATKSKARGADKKKKGAYM